MDDITRELGQNITKTTVSQRRSARRKSDPEYRDRMRAYERATTQKRKLTSGYKEYRKDYFARVRNDPLAQARLKENTRRYREAHRLRRLVYHAKRRALKAGVCFDAQYLDILGETQPASCACCGVIFDYSLQTSNGRPRQSTPTIDKIKPLEGYVAGNVGVICWRCNAIKRDATLAELEAVVDYVKAAR